MPLLLKFSSMPNNPNRKIGPKLCRLHRGTNACAPRSQKLSSHYQMIRASRLHNLSHCFLRHNPRHGQSTVGKPGDSQRASGVTASLRYLGNVPLWAGFGPLLPPEFSPSAANTKKTTKKTKPDKKKTEQQKQR